MPLKAFKTWLVSRYDRLWVLREEIIDYFYDRKLNVSTSWVRLFSEKEQQLTAFGDAGFIMSTPYSKLRKLIKHIDPKPNDVLADIGCGSGRVVLYLAHGPIGRAVGIDFDPGAIESAINNAKRCGLPPEKAAFVCEDATKTELDEFNIIYLYNPFGAQTMSALLDNIAKSLKRNPRSLRIYYHNPTQKALFDRTTWLQETDTLRWGRKPIIVYRNTI